MTVWKFKLKLIDVQQVLMPAGAKILDIQEQYGAPCLWALCDPSNPETQRIIAICGTGNPAPHAKECEYISTFQLHGGSLVFHTFEKKT